MRWALIYKRYDKHVELMNGSKEEMKALAKRMKKNYTGDGYDVTGNLSEGYRVTDSDKYVHTICVGKIDG